MCQVLQREGTNVASATKAVRLIYAQRSCHFGSSTVSLIYTFQSCHYLFSHILSCLCFTGHLMSTAEVEAALTEHPAVAEAAVVSRPHKVKGECLYCFVTLKNSHEFDHTLVDEIKRHGE